MNKQIAKTLLCVMALGSAPLSFADIYSDVMSIAESSAKISGLSEEFLPYMEAMDETNKEISAFTSDHFDWVEDVQWKALTSEYNMSRSITNAVPTELWSASDWDEAIKATAGGNSSRFNDLKTAYAAKNPIIKSGETTSVDVGQLTENSYTQKAEVANTALAASQYVYEDTDNRVATLDEMKKWIDDTSVNKNEKAAIDLNTRALIEVGYIQNEMLRLQSIQSQVQATTAQQETNSATADKQFFDNN